MNCVRTPFYFKILSSFSSCVAPLAFFFLLLGAVCVCVRSPDDREERVTIAQDRKRSSQDQLHGWSKENVRKVASLQSVVSCGSYPLTSLYHPFTPLWFPSGLFFQNSTPNSIIKKKKKKNKVILVCLWVKWLVFCCCHQNLMDWPAPVPGQHGYGFIQCVSLLIIFPLCRFIFVCQQNSPTPKNGNSS
jgi:hypothetical protein